MKYPEKDSDWVPSLKETAQDAATMATASVDYFVARLGKFFSKERVANAVGSQLQQLARWVEPVDRALGKDPMRRREGAFKNGIGVGVFLARSLYLDKPGQVQHALSVFRRELAEQQHPDDTIETAHLRETFIVDTGLRGLAGFPEIETEVETLTDQLNPAVDTRLAFKAGCGMVLGLARAACDQFDMEEMEQLADDMAAKTFDFDTALRDLTAGPDT